MKPLLIKHNGLPAVTLINQIKTNGFLIFWWQVNRMIWGKRLSWQRSNNINSTFWSKKMTLILKKFYTRHKPIVVKRSDICWQTLILSSPKLNLITIVEISILIIRHHLQLKKILINNNIQVSLQSQNYQELPILLRLWAQLTRFSLGLREITLALLDLKQVLRQKAKKSTM